MNVALLLDQWIKMETATDTQWYFCYPVLYKQGLVDRLIIAWLPDWDRLKIVSDYQDLVLQQVIRMK